MNNTTMAELLIGSLALGGMIWWDTKSVLVAFCVVMGIALLIDIGRELRGIHETLETIAKESARKT
jgi:hypothetical protein